MGVCMVGGGVGDVLRGAWRGAWRFLHGFRGARCNICMASGIYMVALAWLLGVYCGYIFAWP